MNKQIRIYAAPLLLSAGVAFSQPTWDDGESFDDFREEWNAWAGSLPADERMYPDLNVALEAFDHERFRELSEAINYWPGYVLTDARPWNKHWEHAERVREVFRDDLDQLIEVAHRPYLGAPIPTMNDDKDRFDAVVPSEWVTRHSLDYVSPFRSTMQYLCGDAVYLAFHGEQDQAIERFKLLDQLCARAIELPGMVQFLTEIAMELLVEDAMFELVEYEADRFSDAQLAEMQSIMKGHLSISPQRVFAFQRFLTQEDWRLQFHSVEFARTNAELRALYHEAAKAYTDGPFSEMLEVVLKPELDPDIPLSTLDQQIAVQSRIFDALMIDLRADPAIQRMPEICIAIRKHLSGRDASRFVPVFSDVGLWRTNLGMMHRFNYQTTNRIVVLALHRHRLRHGEWPTTLDTLDPETLPVPAIDLYSGEPLRYALINGKPRLWALGVDRDDDGGRQVIRDESSLNNGLTWFALDEWSSLSDDQRAKLDGDLVLMN